MRQRAEVLAFVSEAQLRLGTTRFYGGSKRVE
jgi:hypothetical protein